MVFQCINIRKVPWEVLKTAAFMFDPYSEIRLLTPLKKNHSSIDKFCQLHMFDKASDKMAYANSVNPNQTAP